MLTHTEVCVLGDIMCFALVGEVLEFDGKEALVDFEGVSKRVNSEFMKVRKGDRVLVFNNFVIEITPRPIHI